MQRRATDVLHDEDHVLLGIDDLVQLDDVLVLHLLHQFDFSLHRFATVWFLQFVLLVNL